MATKITTARMLGMSILRLLLLSETDLEDCGKLTTGLLLAMLLPDSNACRGVLSVKFQKRIAQPREGRPPVLADRPTNNGVFLNPLERS